jgi:hypothetical protein
MKIQLEWKRNTRENMGDEGIKWIKVRRNGGQGVVFT